MKSKLLDALYEQGISVKQVSQVTGRNETNIRRQLSGAIALTPEIAWHLQTQGVDLGKVILGKPSGKMNVTDVISITKQHNDLINKEIKGTSTDTYALKVPKGEDTEFFGEAFARYKMLEDPTASLVDFILHVVKEYTAKTKEKR